MSLQCRRHAGGITEEAKSPDSLPDADAVIQLERRDGDYFMSVAQFGDTLVTQRLTNVSLPDTVYVGLFVCAHNDTVLERATFSNVRITTPAKRDFVPYRDYIGSNLEILDVATGRATIVHQYSGSFQAPNWTRDGKSLIYAQEGRLYRFDLASRSATAINTGFATRNNNDHVLSFDGRMMAISHHTVEDSGASIVYTVPATGGTPARVTAKGPSYLHGWSPDGRWLVYTGERNGEFDVYKIAATGGEEIRLTTAPGLDDGPEYSPDGAYIYFNSVRSGRMQIWRMRPDGSGHGGSFMRDIGVATVQFHPAASDKPYNHGRIRHFVTEAAHSAVELIAFPEMCLTGYWHVRKLSRAAFEALAEPVPEGPSTRDLLDLSRQHGMTIGAGLLERAPDGGVYNAYVVAMPDGAWAVHRKLHVFEHPNICAGNRYTVFEIGRAHV